MKKYIILLLAILFSFLISCAHKNETVTDKIIKQEIRKTEKHPITSDTMGTMKESVDKIKNINIPEIKKKK